ncbi:hypothetical protein IAT40_004291 [Kwoniella sp. CBS 6097]
MDQALIPLLKKHALRAVRDASKPGGSMDNGDFTMAVARKLIEQKLGFEEGELGGLWKQVVKDIVNEAIEKLDGEDQSEPEAGPSRSSSPSAKPVKSDKSDTKLSKSNKKRSKQHSPSALVEEGEAEEEVLEVELRDEQSEASSQSRGSSKPKKSESVSSDDEGDEQQGTAKVQALEDESDMSSVYDEPPSRSRSKKDSKDQKGSKKGTSKRSLKVASDESSEDERPKKAKGAKRQKKDPNEGLSPDEAKVADLKRIVVACGVRKQWGKEFADCPTTSSQTSHLQRLLSSLGMKGAPTMGKAKSLKMKRELAQELDDVKTFEAARGLSSNGRERRTRGSISKSKTADPDESEEFEGTPPEEDKEKSALGAVMDFLGGDSDSD